MHQCAGHLLFIPHTDDRLQNRTQHGVVVGDKLSKLFVLLHRQDRDGLKAGLDANGRATTLDFAGGGRADRIPLLYKLPATHTLHRNIDQAHIVVLIFPLLLVSVTVNVDSDALDGGQASKLKMFTPEQAVRAQLTGGTGIQHVIQAQLTKVFLLGWEVFGLYDPKVEDILCSSAVVLRMIQGYEYFI